jgi:hypothetical protein
MLNNENKTIPQWCGCKNKNTLKRTKIKAMNTDAVSMLKIKKPKISQFKIIFTYSYYNVFVYYNKITHSSAHPSAHT